MSAASSIWTPQILITVLYFPAQYSRQAVQKTRRWNAHRSKKQTEQVEYNNKP